MWKRLLIAMLCAAAGLGFRSNDGGFGPSTTTGTAVAGNYSGIGQCAGGLVVTGLNKNAPPTCMAIDFANLTGTINQNQIPPGLVFNNPVFNGTLVFPDGSTWTSTGITMPSSSRIAVGSINILGSPPALTFNGMPIGGACPAGDFVNSINAAGVPACGTPTGTGGGSLPTPVSVGNGGLGQGLAPIPGQILIANTATEYRPVTLSGNVTNDGNGVVTITSLPSGLTINNPNITGTVSLPNASITDVMLANAYSGIGNCPANQFVTGLNRNAAPTCATLIGGATVTATPPATPAIGDLWFDPVTVQLYIWFNDGTGSQWVPTINQPTGGGIGPPGPPGTATVTVSATAPVAPVDGTLWFDTTNVQMYIWYFDGTSYQWVPVSHP